VQYKYASGVVGCLIYPIRTHEAVSYFSVDSCSSCDWDGKSTYRVDL